MTPDPSRPTEHSPAARRKPSELLLRVGSAVVMIAIAVALTLAGPWPFLGLVAVAATVLCWEWGRLVRGQGLDATSFGHAAFVVAAGIVTTLGQPLAALGLLVAGALTVAWLAARDPWSVAGVAYFGLPVVALAFIRSDAAYGAAAILSLFAVVWCADTSAYACGRLIGGPKLAPRISPNKTWAGLAGAAFGPAALAFVVALWLGAAGALLLALVSFGLALVSQLGDLVESAAKRAFGIKDVSGLIPGHGGLLDRVDALIFASVAAALLAAMRDAANPGQALVIWP